MNITKNETCTYLLLAVRYLLESMEESMELTEDLVAVIPSDEWCDYKWFDSERDSTPGVRSLLDDLQCLREVAEGDSPFTPVEIDRIAVLLSYVNNRICFSK